MSVSKFIVKANQALDQGNLAVARACLGFALQLDPENCELALALGHTKLEEGDLQGALNDYTQAALLSPEVAPAHSSRALALQLANRSGEARKEAEWALALDAKDTVALKVLARICLNNNAHAEAKRLCQRIEAITPGDPDAGALLQQCVVAPPALEAGALSVNLPSGQSSLPASGFSSQLQSLEGLLGDYSMRCRTWQALGTEHHLQRFFVGDFESPLAIYPQPASAPLGPDGLPLPPADLTMGYGAGNLDSYMACARATYASLSELLADHQLTLGAGDAALDWGCAAGRVLRMFQAEARRGCQLWGGDVHTPSIRWAADHLSPTFRFFNCSSLPPLPFPDRTFKFIYGISVMTHLVAGRDVWLLELARVLRPDGLLVLTVHNESTWAWFREHSMPGWMPGALRSLPEMPGECVEIRGSQWDQTYTFFHSTYLRRVWGQFFDIAEIRPPRNDGYQSAVVMRPRPALH